MSKKIGNIEFMINENCVEFTYGNAEKAWLQLPNTGDSQHIINGVQTEKWTSKEWKIFEQLSEYYFRWFDQYGDGCAAASAAVGEIVINLTETNYVNRTLFIAIDDNGGKHLLIDSDYKDYYNKKHLFDVIDDKSAIERFGDNFNRSDFINSVLTVKGAQW
jgi:hypothetical protein